MERMIRVNRKGDVECYDSTIHQNKNRIYAIVDVYEKIKQNTYKYKNWKLTGLKGMKPKIVNVNNQILTIE